MKHRCGNCDTTLESRPSQCPSCKAALTWQWQTTRGSAGVHYVHADPTARPALLSELHDRTFTQ